MFKKITIGDIDRIFSIFNNSTLTQYFVSGSDKNKGDTKKRIENIITHWNKYGFGDFLLINKSRNMVVGYGGLHYKSMGANINISYIIKPKFQKQGLGYETSMKLLDYGFNTLSLNSIVAEIDPNNKASQKLIEKCGFKFNRIIVWKGFERKEYIMSSIDFTDN
nr:GNAT family N-acetyltransferase [Anaeromonas gelatinilytica]